MVIELAGIIEPIERSSCPAIISKPTGSATIPSSAATLSQLAAPPAERKFAPPNTEKNARTAIRPMSEPISGRRTRLPIEGHEERDANGATASAESWAGAPNFIEGSERYDLNT